MTTVNHVLTTSIFITDAIVFMRDKEITIMDQLKKEYENKCCKYGYVTNINKIIKISACVYDNSTNDANANVNVQFEVSCITFAQGDILTNVIITKNITQLILGRYNDIANVNISSKVLTKGRQHQIMFNENTTVCVAVDFCSYSPKQKATISGKLLVPDTTFETYYIEHDLSESDRREVVKLIELVEYEYSKRAKDKNMLALEHFYYSLKSNTEGVETDGWYGPKFDFSKYINFIDHLKSGKSLIGTWCRPLEIVRSSPFVDFSPEKQTFTTPVKIAIAKILLQMSTWARIMNEQHRVFDHKIFENNKQLWTLFAEIKS